MIGFRRRSSLPPAFLAACLCACLPGAASAAETPTSTGPVAQVDEPVLRIPMLAKPPSIDGVMEPKEWEDASALSGFWYDYGQADFRYLAPDETQVEIYAGFDKENLYLCGVSPIYPEKSWMKTRARFTDVLHHPLYGILWDDHYEIELRPYPDNVKGFRLGLFKWVVNPTNTFSDQCWTQQHGDGFKYKSNVKVRSSADGQRWILELAIPLQSFLHLNYAEKEEHGAPLVPIPPPDGTAYRCWFTRGIGGNGVFFNAFDNHSWNTTKTKLIFDSQCVGFQLKQLGPIMKDAVDVQIALKNHGKRSETVQLGFFVENAEGLVYSSYDDPALSDGFVEVVPGEAKELRLKQRFPGISANGNALWFDVRSTGQPAKVLYRTRLMNFHGMDGGVVNDVPFKWRRLDSIAKLRPPRKDFELRFAYSNYSNKLSAIVDRGVNGASEEAKSAVEAKILVVTADEDEQEVFAGAARFHGNFACLLAEMPELKEGKYKLWTLLLDANQRIVGEAVSDPFAKRKAPWERNELGRNDVVWEPFTPLAVRGLEFETLKHRFTLAPSGLPEQLVIRPEPEDLPLELRAAGAKPEPAQLVAVGRGPQLRAPIRLVARIAGKEVEAAVVEPAKPVRTWQSEVEYQAALKLGALPVRLTTQYDCDGAMTAKLTYGGPEAVEIEALELVMDVAGQVDTALSTTRGGGMASADAWDCALPQKEGVVWDSAALEYPELVYTHFVPWFWFGSGDRAFTWICDSDEHWLLDRDGSSMLLERDKQGEVTLRVKFVNHKAAVNGERTVTFMLLTHPAKPKPAGHRELSWNLRGAEWAEGYMQAWGPIDKPDHLLDGDRVKEIESYKKRKVPEDAALAKLAETEPLQFHADAPPWRRYYQLRGMVGPLPAIVENAYTGDLLGENRGQPAPVTSVRLVDSQEQKVAVERAAGAMCQMGEAWQDLFVYYLGRHVRISRKHGWWWDETWPVYRNDCLATGAYLRDPQDVRLKTEETDEEVPWQPSYLTLPMRGMFKRLARVFKESNVPNRNQFWANNSATAFESFGFDTQLVEECCADPKSLDLDNVVVYPLPLFRYAAHNYSGLVARITSLGIAGAGDDKKYDRQYIGRGLLHDIGVQPVGPHGRHSHVEQFMRIQNRLYEFGYFEPQGTEYLPYWRNGAFVQAGREGDPGPSKLHVSVFRRRFEKDGRAGTHAIFVLMNEHDEAVEAPLRLLDDARLLGGKNGLTAAEVYAGASVAEPLKAWWAGLAQRDGAAAALRDFETGEAIPRQGEAETYGPVFVPAHDYRVLYARRLDPK